MTYLVQHIISPGSNPYLHKRFSTKIPKHFRRCVGVTVVLEFADIADKFALGVNDKDLQKPIGMLSISFDGRNTATLHVPVTLEPILFDGAIDYDIDVMLGSMGEISGHFLNNLSEQNITGLNIKLLYKLL
ncbi:MAG: hypothetical protein FWE63_01980 [Bacteroidales bacterium]|nr:hypothetical protein [Bacteroidales bacterium]